VSAGLTAAGEVGSSGEFSSFHLSGGVAGDLSVFVLTPELLQNMCCGAVSGGVKFCTLGASRCTYTSHQKKVGGYPNEFYITAPRNTAYSNHHASTSLLSDDQLTNVLLEHHTKEEWARLLYSLNAQANERPPQFDSATDPTKELDQLHEPAQAVSAITPSRKCRQRADKVAASSKEADPSLILSSQDSDLSDFDLVPIPSEEDGYGTSAVDRLSNMILD
jgi:hypothetical protein